MAVGDKESIYEIVEVVTSALAQADYDPRSQLSKYVEPAISV